MNIILTLLAFLFGAAAYFAEQNDNGEVFDSISKATYWGIMTIATVGYAPFNTDLDPRLFFSSKSVYLKRKRCFFLLM
jgi:hypothetical protein